MKARSKRQTGTAREGNKRRVALIASISLLAMAAIGVAVLRARTVSPHRLPPTSAASSASDDPRERAAALISYNESIALTPEQQKVMTAALTPIAAPCCNRNSMATCCCPCNLAKSVWGLSKYLIAREHADQEAVRSAALEWIHSVNPRGFSGDACFSSGCNRPFESNGCGGMNATRIM